MSKKNILTKTPPTTIMINQDHSDRRIDNYLIRYLRQVPRSRIYQMLRKGEVRVNKGRIKQSYRLVAGDEIRLPPIYKNDQLKDQQNPSASLQKTLLDAIIYEDAGMLILNKPAGLAVHGGSQNPYGLIEAIRLIDKDYATLELVHRLDKETSGCLILAKKMPVLRELHTLIKNNQIEKSYYALLDGQIHQQQWIADQPLRKNKLLGGRQKVNIDVTGKAAKTIYFRERLFANATLVRIKLVTGRTHQIRVHSAEFLGHPVVGDDRYGNRKHNQQFRKKGLKRLFLHASSLRFQSPVLKRTLAITAPLPTELLQVLEIIGDPI